MANSDVEKALTVFAGISAGDGRAGWASSSGVRKAGMTAKSIFGLS